MSSDSVEQKLDILIRLQAAALVRDLASKKDKIIFLGSAGLPPKLIAEISQSSPAAVSQALYVHRKKAGNGSEDPQ